MTSPPPPPLTAAQRLLVAVVLRRAAAVELALGNDQVAGLRLVAFLAEAKDARGAPTSAGRAA